MINSPRDSYESQRMNDFAQLKLNGKCTVKKWFTVSQTGCSQEFQTMTFTAARHGEQARPTKESHKQLRKLDGER